MELTRKAVVLFLISFALYIGLSTVIGSLLPQGTSYALLLLLSALCVSIPAFLAPALIFRAKNGLRTGVRLEPVHLLIALGLGVGCIVLNLSLALLTKALTYNIEIQSTALNVRDASEEMNIFLMILTVALIPAVSEEYLMRGALLEAWRRSSPIGAAVLTSLLFGLLHLAPSNIIVYFAMGMLFAAVYLISRNVWLTIIIHFMNNLITTVLAYVQTEPEAELARGDCFGMFIVLGVVAAAIIVPLLMWLNSSCKKLGIGAYGGDALAEASRAEGGTEEQAKRGLFSEPLVWVTLLLLIAFNVLCGLVEFGVIDLGQI